jgi:DNA-binding Lrp family transcriptional regulator
MQDNQYNIIKLSFADTKIPECKEVRGEDFVRFGEKNDFPDELLKLQNKSSKHRAILNGKCTYIFGEGLKGGERFTARANETESWNDLARKVIRDQETFGGFYLEIMPLMGGGRNYYHIPFKKVRPNKKKNKFLFKKDWNDRADKGKWYKAFSRDLTEPSIFFYREYNADDLIMPLPSYVACLNYIQADVEVSKAILTKAKHGFSASKLITFKNGEPGEDAKRVIDKQFKNQHGGAEGDPVVIQFIKPGDSEATIQDLGASDLTKEDFTRIDAIITQNIFSGHGVTHPLLFGIQQEGKLGSATELRTAYDTFKNTYVAVKKKQVEDVINFFAGIAGVKDKIILSDVDPVGFEFSEATMLQVAPKSWLLEKMGIDPTKYADAPAVSTGEPVTEEMDSEGVNEHLKNIKGSQHMHLKRIIREYKKGVWNRKEAGLFLKGFGLSEDDIATLLGDQAKQDFSIQMEAEFQENLVSALFSDCGEDSGDYIVIRKDKATFDSDEETRIAMKFAETLSGTDASILGLIQKDKRISPQTIAESLQIPVSVVNEAIKTLTDSGAIKSKVITENDTKITVREVVKPASSLPKSEKTEIPQIFIRYTYETIPGAGSPIIPGTRPFCKKMVELSASRFWSRSDIERISEKVGYSVWDRRGGFWNKGGEISPSCRHYWASNVVIKKK